MLVPSKISGAIHRALRPHSGEAFHIESRPWVIIASPKSVIRAWPVTSIRMLDWLDVNVVKYYFRRMTYSLEISMNHIAVVEVVKAFSNVG